MSFASGTTSPISPGRLRAVEIERGGLADRRLRLAAPELLAIAVQGGDGEPRDVVPIAGAAEVERVVPQREEVRLLRAAHADLGMLPEVVIQRRRARLGRTQDDEIGQGHRA